MITGNKQSLQSQGEQSYRLKGDCHHQAVADSRSSSHQLQARAIQSVQGGGGSDDGDVTVEAWGGQLREQIIKKVKVLN